MPAKYGLRSRFEAEGIFWPSNNPHARFSARLISTKRSIELAVAAESAGPERLFPSPNDELAPDVMHGYTTIGKCTLMGLQEFDGVRQFEVETQRTLLTRRYRVGACVVGAYLGNESEPIWRSATFSFAGVGDWLRPATQIRITDKALVISHPTPAPTIVDFCMVPTMTHIELRMISDMTWSPSGRHSSSRDEPQIEITPEQPASLGWFIDVAVRFENFFSLCLGTSVQLRSVQLLRSARDMAWFVRPIPGKVGTPDIEAWIRCDASQLATAMSKWLATPEKFRPLENLIYGAIRNSSMFVETEFLSLAQGVESFHRLTQPVLIADQLTFKRALKAILKLILTTCGESALATRLIESIRHANEPSFRNRVESLIRGLPPEHVEALLGDPEEFERRLRQTRNFFTHPGTKKGSRVLTGVKEIFLFNQRLHAFLRLLMLTSVGFREADVFRLVHYQSRRWR